MLSLFLEVDPGYRVGEPYKQKDDTGTSVEAVLFDKISKLDLPQYCGRLEAKGYYWHVADPREIQRLNQRPEELGELFRSKIEERILKWAGLVTKHLPEGVVCLWTGGNDDDEELLKALYSKDLGRFVYAEERVITIEAYEIISLGYSNRTPFNTARELDERDLLNRLEQLGKAVSSTDRLVMNVHVPPINCGSLDAVIAKGSGELINVGSSAVRTFIENIQPLADFCGHVHEGQGVTTIGRTYVFNPGSDYNSGTLDAFVVTVTGSSVTDYARFSR